MHSPTEHEHKKGGDCRERDRQPVPRTDARKDPRPIGGPMSEPRISQYLLNIHPDVRNVVAPVLGLLLQATLKEQPNAWMQVRWQAFPVRFPRKHSSKNVGRGGAFIDLPPDQHLEQHDTERPNVRPLVHFLTSGLLGRHIRSSSKNHSLLGCCQTQRRRLGQVCFAPVNGECLRQTEVQHLDLTVRCDLDVSGLQISVNDALLVCGFEGFGNLEYEFEGFFDRDRAALEPIGQGVAFDQFEDEEPRAVVFFEAIDCGDVGMVQRGQQFRFTFKPGQPLFVFGELFGKRLDGHFAPELGVPRTPHLAHTTLAERGEDLVAAELGAGGHWLSSRRAVQPRKTISSLKGFSIVVLTMKR